MEPNVHYQTSKNDSLEVSKGLMPGVSPLFAIGYNDNIDGGIYRTIWDKDQNYFFSKVADISLIVSDNINDNGIYLIKGLDSEWNYSEVMVAINGITPVSFPNLIRINSIRQVYGATNQGGITCYITGGSPTTPDDIRAYIRPSFGRTLMAVYSVPAGYSGYFNNITCRNRRRGSTGDISSTCYAEVRLFGGDFVKEMAFPLHTEGGQQDISSDNYFKIPEKSDIIITVMNDSANNGVFTANINGKLVKNQDI